MKFLGLTAGDRLELPAFGTLPSTVHVFDQRSIDAVNAALAAGRPLLVRGEPGTGKSQLARAAAQALGRAFLSTVIDARSEARDLLWRFDAVARLAEAQVQGALGKRSEKALRENLAEKHFLNPGPLWWAFDWGGAETQAKAAGGLRPVSPEGWTEDQGTVLLLDEIDKADSSVPNGLLEALGLGRFACPGGGVVSSHAGPAPLLVITTNEERALPDPFLRRCLVLHLAWPEAEAELEKELIERGRAHFPTCFDQVLLAAAEMLIEDRASVAARGLCPPGGAEYLDLLRALGELAPDDGEEQQRLLAKIAPFALDKHPPEQPG